MDNPNGAGMLMTTSQVAHLLHVHPNTVRKWVSEGLLSAYRLGPRGDRRFTHEEIDRFLRAGPRPRDG